MKEAEVKLELAFHHANRANREQLTAGLARLSELSEGGNHAHYAGIARFMSGLPPTPEATAQWGETPRTMSAAAGTAWPSTT
ncbi:hypothetical protein [Streptomyces sp. NPDC017993]|uniref:hypothetical protein n=1 Tax=Streptomyces sp. NPDC017993 TaxID=3365027 RepID=UPI0037A2EAFF